MIRESMWLSISWGGMAMPVPASTARAWVISEAPLSKNRKSCGRQPTPQPRARVRLPGNVGHRQIAPFGEAILRRGLPAVETGRRGRVVRPGFDRRRARAGRDFELGLARRAVDHVDRAADGAPTAEAGFGGAAGPPRPRG